MTAESPQSPPLCGALSVATWNIDFDSPHIYLRTRAVIDALLAAAPDAIALQEVSAVPIARWHSSTMTNTTAAATGGGGGAPNTHPQQCSLRMLEARLAAEYDAAYDVGEAAEAPYFVAAFVRRDRFRTLEYEYTAFERSAQGRGVLSVALAERASGRRLRLLTSHLESCPEGAALRKEQLATVAHMMLQQQQQQQSGVSAVPTLFAGDTNLRVSEVSAELVQSSSAKRDDPRKLQDAYVQCGEPVHARYTWDTLRNANRAESFPPNVRPRARYDRVFVSGGVRATSMQLLGAERLAVGVHPSDHFGLYVRCEMTASAETD